MLTAAGGFRLSGITLRVAWGAFGILLVTLIWWFFALLLGSTRLPDPASVYASVIPSFTYMKTLAGLLGAGGAVGILPNLIYSVRSVLAGTAIGGVLAVGVGLMVGWSRRVRSSLEPVLEALRAIPPLAFIPFLVLWFGAGIAPQLLLIVIYVFFILVIYTINAIDNVSPVYRQFAFTMGASRGGMFRTVVLPSIIPELTGGLRVIVAVGWGLQVVAELVGSPLGMGQVFVELMGANDVAGIIVGLIYIAIVATMTDAILLYVSRYVTRWMPRRAT